MTDWNLGMVPQYEDDELEGEPIEAPEWNYEPLQLIARREGGTSTNDVPFSPRRHWTLAPPTWTRWEPSW